MHLLQHLQYIIHNEYENPFLKMGSDYGSFNIRILNHHITTNPLTTNCQKWSQRPTIRLQIKKKKKKKNEQSRSKPTMQNSKKTIV